MELIFPVCLYTLSVVVLVAVASRAFRLRPIEFSGATTTSRIVTSPMDFWSGQILYCIFVLVSYGVITYYWGPLKHAFGPIFEHEGGPIARWLKSTEKDPSEVTAWIAAGFLILLFSWDSKYNPLTIILESVLDIIRVPEKANSVFTVLKATKFGRLHDELAGHVCDHPAINNCGKHYFALDRRDAEYKWSHICYLHYQLHMALIKHPDIFNEKSLRWTEIGESYDSLSKRFDNWLRGERDYREAIELFEELSKLKEQMYRLLSCVMVRTNHNQRDVWEAVDALSMASAQAKPGRLGRYLVFLISSLFASILLGREISTWVYLRFVEQTNEITPFDIKRFKFWLLVSLVVYSLPISFAFFGRSALSKYWPYEQRRYWGIYLACFLVGYIIAAMALPVFEGVTQLNPLAAPYWESVYEQGLFWALMPGFATAFVVFRMDSHASVKDTRWDEIKDRLKAAAVCMAVALGVGILGSMSDKLSAPKEFVAVFTTVLVGGAIGWLSRFCVR